MLEAKDLAKLYLDRYNGLIKTTSGLLLGFAFTLCLTWYTGVRPTINQIRSDITTKAMSDHLDSVNKHLGIRRKAAKKDVKKYDSLYAAGIINDSVYKSVINKIVAGRFARLDTAVKRVAQKKATVIALRNTRIIKIDIPTLKPVELEFYAGVFVYLILVFILMLYVFQARRRAYKYLNMTLEVYVYELKGHRAALEKMDLQIPFWMMPVRPRSSVPYILSQDVAAILHMPRAIYRWILAIVVVLLPVLLSLATFWILEEDVNVNRILLDGKYREPVVFLEVMRVVVSFTLALAAYWLIADLNSPFKLRPRVPAQPELPFKPEIQKLGVTMPRNEFVRIAGLASIAFVLLRPLDQLLPFLKAHPLHYKRVRKRKGKAVIKVKPGFYIHKRKGISHIHYVSTSGRCKSLDSLPEVARLKAQASIFHSALSEQELLSLLGNNESSYSFPFAATSIEDWVKARSQETQDPAGLLTLLLWAIRLTDNMGSNVRVASLFLKLHKTYTGKQDLKAKQLQDLKQVLMGFENMAKNQVTGNTDNYPTLIKFYHHKTKILLKQNVADREGEMSIFK